MRMSLCSVVIVSFLVLGATPSPIERMRTEAFLEQYPGEIFGILGNIPVPIIKGGFQKLPIRPHLRMKSVLE